MQSTVNENCKARRREHSSTSLRASTALALTPLIAITIAPNLALVYASRNLFEALSTALAPAILITIALYALWPKLCMGFFALLAPAALMEVLYILRYERVTDEHVFAILRETNFREALAWLGPLGCMLLVTGIALLITAATALSRQTFTLPKFPPRWRYILIMTGFATAAITYIPEFFLNDYPAFSEPEKVAPTQSADHIGNRLTGDLEHASIDISFPWGVPIRLARYVDLEAGMKDAREALASFRFSAHQAAERSTEDEIIVLVIGETGRPDRWQINGYQRPTNPRLSKQEGVISFTDVISGWAWTRMSVPVIISRKPSRMFVSFFPERSIISAFREAGFWTAWYSMHGPLGFHESAVALHAGEAEDVRFINPAGYRSPGAYDGALLAPLEEALSHPDRKKFIVLHTMGSHFNYADRNPAEFDVFGPSLRGYRNPDLHDSRQRERLNNSYDNSVIYTDHVLAEIIERLQNTGKVAVLLHVADHGENLFDADCDKSGHGHNTDRDHRIAALWWSSPAFGNRHPEKLGLLASRRDTPWSTENVFNTLIDAADIRIPGGATTAQSLFATDFTPQARWVQSGADFDKAERVGACGEIKTKTGSGNQARSS